MPANPKVTKGIRLLYLGSTVNEYVGSSSGLRFWVGAQRRQFVVPPDDAPALLKRRHIILAP